MSETADDRRNDAEERSKPPRGPAPGRPVPTHIPKQQKPVKKK